MAKLVFGLNQSLDGYVDYLEFAPGPSLFRHFYEQVRDLTGSVYGRRMYEVMRIWDEDRPEWGAEQRDFAAAWRSQPKWVVSRSLKSVGPNAAKVKLGRSLRNRATAVSPPPTPVEDSARRSISATRASSRCAGRLST